MKIKNVRPRATVKFNQTSGEAKKKLCVHVLLRKYRNIYLLTGNIFIHRNPKPASPESGIDEEMCDEIDTNSTELITYKIGMCWYPIIQMTLSNLSQDLLDVM